MKKIGCIGHDCAECKKTKRRIATLERNCRCLHAMLLPGQAAVYRAAMQWHRIVKSSVFDLAAVARIDRALETLHKDCARAEKRAEKGAKR